MWLGTNSNDFAKGYVGKGGAQKMQEMHGRKKTHDSRMSQRKGLLGRNSMKWNSLPASSIQG